MAAANAQMRLAGLGEHQMHVSSTGKVTTPDAPAKVFKTKAAGATGSTATTQAKAGARAAGAPTPTGVHAGGGDTFRITWAPVSGAKAYGVWQDGALIGTVTDPQFAGQLAAGTNGTITIDAVLADGTRSARTPSLVVTRDGSAAIAFSGAMAETVAAAQSASQAAATAAPATAT
ncbi:MAG: hypothetical protein H7287_00130, partial [Thermoleophilia bacterium]|nr:hypothetical protein [Thermoleophilia bacterium]